MLRIGRQYIFGRQDTARERITSNATGSMYMCIRFILFDHRLYLFLETLHVRLGVFVDALDCRVVVDRRLVVHLEVGVDQILISRRAAALPLPPSLAAGFVGPVRVSRKRSGFHSVSFRRYPYANPSPAIRPAVACKPSGCHRPAQ